VPPGKVDLALLDVHLAGETVFPVSEMLDAIGVPYIFLTSHPVSSLPGRYEGRPLLTKPFRPSALLALIQQILGGRPTDSANAALSAGGSA
jgi:DNA-binding response OmpR family regulator